MLSLNRHQQNFEQLLRWIYDKPANPKPPLGKQPEFLNENAIQLPTQSRARRAVELLRNGSSQADGAIQEYLSVLADNLEAFRIEINKFDLQQYDQPIVDNIAGFLPYRDEFITVASALARYSTHGVDKHLRRFFENAVPYMFRPKSFNGSFYEWYWDNFRFIIHELFLYSVALSLKHERFDAALEMMTHGYYVGDAIDRPHEPMQPFTVILQQTQSMVFRNQRLRLNRLSVRADLLKTRSHASGVPFILLMQADFILFFFNSLISHKQKSRAGWLPQTLVYYPEYAPPFEVFARAESSRYFQKVCPLLAVSNKSELTEAVKLFGYQNAPLLLPHWGGFHFFSLNAALNLEKLASKP